MASKLTEQTSDLFSDSYPQMKKDETPEETKKRFTTPYNATWKDVKTPLEFTPIIGDAIALAELPENAQEAFSLLKGGFETRDVIRLGKGAGLAALAALDLTAVGDVAKPLIKKAKDALRGTADALSPQAVTDTGIPVDIPDTNTNVTKPINQQKPKALEMQVRATGTTERYKGAVNDYNILLDKYSKELENLKVGNTLNPKKTLDFLDYNLGDTSKAAQDKYFDIGDNLSEDLTKNVILEDFIIQRAYQNMPEEKRLAFLKAYPNLAGMSTLANVPREKIVSHLSVEDIEDFTKRKLYQQTGVYRGIDGQLKTEIATGEAFGKTYQDGAISFDYDPTTAFNYIKSKNKEVTVKDILDFPSLYNNKRYGNPMQFARSSSDRKDYLDAERDAKLKGEPILSMFSRFQPIQDVKVEMRDGGDEGWGALYYPNEDKIVLNTSLTNAVDFRSALLHELQHAIQNREGFDFGASFREFLPSKYADVDVNDIPIDEYNKALAKRNRVGGEYEADLVEYRDAEFGPDAGPDLYPFTGTADLGGKAIFPFDTGPPIKDEDIIKRPLNVYPKEMNKGRGTRRTADTFPETIESATKELNIDYDYIKPSQEFYDQLPIEDMSKLSDTNLENLIESNGETFETIPSFDLSETNPKAYKAAEIKQKALFNEFDARRKKYSDKYKKIKSIIDENPEDIHGQIIDNTAATLYENPSQYGKEIKNAYGNFEGNSLAYQEVFLNNFDSMFADLGLGEKGYKYNKGGVTMKKQMNLFQDGGLEQDGGTVDPASGNEVPMGSAQEEVRDDIPAQLSEGEFVFPADVVRYIGLEKLMMMRQKAKEGLSKMEAMGQMGNSDEATIPDDMPFNEEDLIAEDDEGNVVEMAAGGVVRKYAEGSTNRYNEFMKGTGIELQEFVNPATGETVQVRYVNGQYIPFNPFKRGFIRKGEPVPTPKPVQPTQMEQAPQEQKQEREESEWEKGVVVNLGTKTDKDGKVTKVPYAVRKDLLTGEVFVANEEMDKAAGFSSPQWMKLDLEKSQALGFSKDDEGVSKDSMMTQASFGDSKIPLGASITNLKTGKDDPSKAEAQEVITGFQTKRAEEQDLEDMYKENISKKIQQRKDFDALSIKDKFKKVKEIPGEIVSNLQANVDKVKQEQDKNEQDRLKREFTQVAKADIQDKELDKQLKEGIRTEEDLGYDLNKGGIATKKAKPKKKVMKRGGLASKK